MEDRSISCRLTRQDAWQISVNGCKIALDKSFDVAVRTAYALLKPLACRPPMQPAADPRDSRQTAPVAESQ